MELFAGVDIGSATSKCVLLDERGEQLAFEVIMTEFDRSVSGRKVLAAALEAAGAHEEDVRYVVSTGCGRRAFERADKDLPEIIAHGMGTHWMDPEARTIIDIGGQDSKVIELDGHGAVARFEMNDRCAAGTGRFFEVLSHRLLGIEMAELSDLMKKATAPCAISSACTVFAESEVISLLSGKVPAADIAAGMGRSMARRIISMGRAAQITFEPPIVFSGGAANNAAIAEIFAELLGRPVRALSRPQSPAALGAALTARQEYAE